MKKVCSLHNMFLQKRNRYFHIFIYVKSILQVKMYLLTKPNWQNITLYFHNSAFLKKKFLSLPLKSRLLKYQLSFHFFHRPSKPRMNGYSVYNVTVLNALRHKLKELLILHQIAKLAPAIIWKENCIVEIIQIKIYVCHWHGLDWLLIQICCGKIGIILLV